MPEIPDDYLPRSVEEVLDSAPRGFPRPVHPSGLPTPYIANQDDLSDANAFRRALCVVGRRCQVCGENLGVTAVVCWVDGDEMVADGAALHPDRCWPLARRACPTLARLDAAGRLVWREVLTLELQIARTDERGYEDGMPIGYEVPK